MKNRSLAVQLNMLFTIVILITSVFFVVNLKIEFNKLAVKQDEIQQEDYLNRLVENYQEEILPESEYNGYIILYGRDFRSIRYDGLGIISEERALNAIRDVFPNQYILSNKIIIDDIRFIGRRLNDGSMVITFTDGRYQSIADAQMPNNIILGFVSAIILGNVIILIWSNLLVERIKNLKTDVSMLSKKNYNHKINVDGNDEITELALTIEKMRQEIYDNEANKQDMLQNISHDFKTPISVIRSYTEAVKDGISDIEDLEVVIKQTDILTRKVKQLLELNKLEYLKNPETFVDIKVKEVIESIINHHKYFNHVVIEADLDNSTYHGTNENLYIAITNIVENALRYAKSKITITLKNKKLTIHNDGKPIETKYLENIFKPYQKGHGGEYGLGLYITYKTLNHFNLSIDVENINDGVAFIIKPL